VGRGVGLKVGREFWEFMSGDPDCMSEILELAAAAADTPIEGESFDDRIERKAQEITAEFEAEYGSDLDDPQTWARFLADNS
jgi:hypothetical protein